jgi:hypothetical protein
LEVPWGCSPQIQKAVYGIKPTKIFKHFLIDIPIPIPILIPMSGINIKFNILLSRKHKDMLGSLTVNDKSAGEVIRNLIEHEYESTMATRPTGKDKPSPPSPPIPPTPPDPYEPDEPPWDTSPEQQHQRQ